MNGKNATLPSLRIIKWWSVKTETEKINQVLIYIATNNITELNELVNARPKLVFEKKAPRKNKTRMEYMTGNADKKKSTNTG